MKRFSYPYAVWMTVLVAIPILIMLTQINWSELDKLTEAIYVNAFLNSFRLSGYVTIISLLIGYPIAYMLARTTSRFKSLWLVMIIVPTWSNMLLRVIAWETLFFPSSILNSIGISLDLIGTDLAIVIGMVSIFLPFMIFPIYAVLDKLDVSIEEASADLGAGPWQTFVRVTLPLSTSGILSGIIMTFLPSATAFAIPQRLGGGNILLIGNMIERLFRTQRFELGSLLTIVLIAIIFIGMRILSKIDSEGETLL
jgi:spermidine/putrescine transport system permease protein